MENYPRFLLGNFLSLELCRGHKDEADKYWKKLEKCIVIKDGKNCLQFVICMHTLCSFFINDTLPVFCVSCSLGQRLVPRLYYVPKSELAEDGESVATARDLSFSMEPMLEAIPFQWAQALYLTTKLASMYVCMYLKGGVEEWLPGSQHREPRDNGSAAYRYVTPLVI